MEFNPLAEDEDDDLDGNTEGFYTSIPEEPYREAVLLVIDVSSKMFWVKDWYRGAMSTCIFFMKRKMLCAPDDKVAVCLYGTREKNNPNNFEHIYFYNDLAKELSADLLTEMQKETERTEEDFEKKYGRDEGGSLSDLFWVASTSFSLALGKSAQYYRKRLFFFTASPFPKTNSEVINARIGDCREQSIELSLFLLDQVDASWKQTFQPTEVYSQENLEQLEREMRKKVTKKRVVARIPFDIAGVEIKVSVFINILQARIPSPIKLHAVDNALVKTETRQVNVETGKILAVSEIRQYTEIADEKVPITRKEMNELKVQQPKGIKLLGFKHINALQPHHHVDHSYMIYPLEEKAKGSSVMFQSLLNSMEKQNKFALASVVLREGSETRLAALFPDKINMLLTFLPYGDDIRYVETQPIPLPAPEAVAACRDLLDGILVEDFHPDDIENIVLQEYQATVEAYGLGEENKRQTEDMLTVDQEMFQRNDGAIKRWQAAAPRDYTKQKAAKAESWKGKGKGKGAAKKKAG